MVCKRDLTADKFCVISMDDPLIWGLLPMRFWNKRWSFGSHDICFQGRYVEIEAAVQLATYHLY